MYFVSKVFTNILLAKSELSLRKKILTIVIKIENKVIMLIFKKFLFLEKAPNISNIIPEINRINSGKILFKFDKLIIFY